MFPCQMWSSNSAFFLLLQLIGPVEELEYIVSWVTLYFFILLLKTTLNSNPILWSSLNKEVAV